MDPGIFNPRSSTPAKLRCWVKDCNSQSNVDLRLCFHAFPKANQFFIKKKNDLGEIESIDRHDAWKIALDLKEVPPKFKVCSLHFVKDDYFFSNQPLDDNAKKRYLKKNVVPSLFVPKDFSQLFYMNNSENPIQTIKQKNVGYIESINMKEAMKVVSEKVEPFDIIDLVDEDTKPPNIVEIYPLKTSEGKISKRTEPTNTKIAKTYRHAAVQVNSDYPVPKFVHFIKTDSELNTLTGIETFETLDAVIAKIKKEYGDKYETESSEMKIKDKVIMTCAKIKNNLSYSLLAIMFKGYYKKMSDGYCQEIYNSMIEVLYNCLKKTSRGDVVFHTLKNLGIEDYRKTILYR